MIPKHYLEALNQQHPPETMQIGGQGWRLFSVDHLTGPVTIDGRETLAWQMLSSYAASFRQLTGQSSTVDHRGNDYSLERLKNAVAVGDNDSGAILYIDLDNDDSLWAYHPDGGDVQPLDSSIDELLGRLGVSSI